MNESLKKGLWNACIVILCLFALFGALNFFGISRDLLRDTGGANGVSYSDVTSQLTVRVPLEFSEYMGIMNLDMTAVLGCQCPEGPLSKNSYRRVTWRLTVSEEGVQVLELAKDTVVPVNTGGVPH